MIVKIKLNNIKYRYGVYQIINLFYNLYDIQFVEEDWDFFVQIDKNAVICWNKDIQDTFLFDEELTANENVKKAVFMYFSNRTGKKFPWGTLVGIRPSKIALELLNKGKNDNEIIEYFYRHSLTERDKAELCIHIAKTEQQFVNKEKDKISVYIDMPFCPTRCLYCSFASNPVGKCNKLVEPYLKALVFEMKSMAKYINEKKLKIQCVYFGGGTPTAIDEKQFEYVVSNIYDNFILDNNVEEFTIECGRPDSITEEKLKIMKKYFVDRISINPQTMNDETLKSIGRKHSVLDVIDKFNLARSLGFDNINMDIIVGLPGEGIEHVKRTCNEILKLKPENITVHGMTVKRGSRLYENIINNYKLNPIEQDEFNAMYKETMKLSKVLNMKSYYMYRQKNMIGNMENIGYTVSGNECIYNIQMIEERQTIIALGADAVSKVVFLEENRIERCPNVKDVIEYTNRVEEMVERKIKELDNLY